MDYIFSVQLPEIYIPEHNVDLRKIIINGFKRIRNNLGMQFRETASMRRRNEACIMARESNFQQLL